MPASDPAALAAERASYAPAKAQQRALDRNALPGAPEQASFEGAVLFADISGFTPLAARLAARGPAGAEELSRLLNAYFGELLALIAAHGGEPLKFAGDALIALWPADAAVQRAAGCALAIQAALHGHRPGSGDPLTLRIAIAHGRLEGAQLRSGDAWHFVVAGRPMNDLAGALQQARPGDVVVTASAASALGDSARLAPAGEDCQQLLQVAPLPPASTVPADWTRDALARLEGYVPGPVRARLAAGHGEWLAELRQVTALFAQIPNLDHTAAGACDALQALLERAQPVVRRYDGHLKELVIDDKGVVMVIVFGLPPSAHEDDPARGARAALDLDEAIRAQGYAPAMGLATGRCFCGVVGSDVRREYAVVGDAMNVAARLMEVARGRAGGARIVCDMATRKGASARVAFETLPPVAVKGKGAPVNIARPLAPREPSRRAAHDVVGRHAELAAIEDALQRGARGESPGRLLFIGEAGLGKSCLVEAMGRAAAAAGVTALVGAGDAVEAGTPYHPWRRVFAQLLGVAETADAGARRLQVERALGAELAARAPLLEAVLALGSGDSPETAALSGATRAAASHELLLALLERAAAERPTAIVLEDAHWFDPASWALALDTSRRLPALLLAVTTRPIPDPAPPELAALAAQADCATHVLAPLSGQDTVAVACRRLGVPALPAEVDAAIRARASGHPFFAEELGLALRDAGVIEVVNGECRLARGVVLAALEFPQTVQGAVTARIDRLAPREQLAIKVASVIGPVFPLRVLRGVHPVPADLETLDGALQALHRADLTLPEAPEPEASDAFKHVITREVAYNLMLFSQRRQLHRRIAEWHEQAYGDSRPELYALLAHHWSRAGDVPKAVACLEKNATRVFSMGLGKAAVEQGLEAARLLGVALPVDPQEIVPLLGAELGRIQALLADRAPATLIDQPPLVDETVGAVIGVLLRTMPFAHQSLQAELFASMALRCMSLTLEHGNGPAAPVVYAMHSIVYRAMTGDVRTACEFSELALALDQRNGSQLQGPTSFIYTWFNQHWLYPLARALPMSLAAAGRAFELGDVLYGCFNLSAHVVQLATAGRPLEQVIEVARRHLALNGRRVLNAAFHCVHELQFAKALAGRTEAPTSMTDAEHDEARDVASICATDHYNQIGFYFISRLKLHYHYRDYAAALAAADKAGAVLPAFAGQTGEFELCFFHALALLARAREVEGGERDALVAAAQSRLRQLQAWAALCADNFQHKALLVEAELEVTEARPAQALERYLLAASTAAAAGAVQHEALAQELRAYVLRGLQDTGWEDAAAAAREAYGRWGAQAKVRDIEMCFGPA